MEIVTHALHIFLLTLISVHLQTLCQSGSSFVHRPAILNEGQATSVDTPSNLLQRTKSKTALGTLSTHNQPLQGIFVSKGHHSERERLIEANSQEEDNDVI